MKRYYSVSCAAVYFIEEAYGKDAPRRILTSLCEYPDHVGGYDYGPMEREDRVASQPSFIVCREDYESQDRSGSIW